MSATTLTTLPPLTDSERRERARLDPDAMRCERCRRPLDSVRAVWLELSWKTGRFCAEGTLDPEHSQGCFPFGADCARTTLASGGRA